MKRTSSNPESRLANVTRIAGGLILAVATCASCVAQAESSNGKPADLQPSSDVVRTLYLSSSSEQHALMDILTDMRNMIPRAKLYGVASQNAISIRGSAEDVAMAEKILADMDKPRRVYRLTYTITDVDNGRKMGSQQFSLIVLPGEKTYLKQGTKVPIVTGSYDKDTEKAESQVQYLDVGMYIEASIDGDRLRSKVEQSSVADEKSGIGMQDPIIRQAVLEEMSTLAQGKPVVLGSLDVPGGTHRQQIEVAAEIVP